jgi:hypothetical protein
MTSPLIRRAAGRNIHAGAVESSSLWRLPHRACGHFHARTHCVCLPLQAGAGPCRTRTAGVLPYGGAPSVGNASGLSRAAFERSRRQDAVESLLRGDRNATLEASMVEPRRALEWGAP